MIDLMTILARTAGAQAPRFSVMGGEYHPSDLMDFIEAAKRSSTSD